jgi:peptidoglycan/xylan/chitin deacetylase (PgdA/CDA1 family)
MMAVPVPILLYHSIAERPDAGAQEFALTPAVFAEHVRAMCAAGRTPLTVGALARALRGERALPPRPLLVTFDDGFADVMPAVELLLSSGLAASVFVAAGSIESRGMVSQDDLRELVASGGWVEIGAHSVTHARLDELSCGRAAAEICVSKSALESVVQAPIDSFAYPHGAYDKRVRSAVVDAGFSAAAAVKNALSHSQDDVYALARVTVTAGTTAGHIEMLLDGSGAPLARRRELFRTRSYRSFRRLRRRLGWALA